MRKYKIYIYDVNLGEIFISKSIQTGSFYAYCGEFGIFLINPNTNLTNKILSSAYRLKGSNWNIYHFKMKKKSKQRYNVFLSSL